MNPFKNNQGKFLTKGLFWEYDFEPIKSCVYTLKDYDHMSYPSLYRLYMESDDITEYSFARTHLDGWRHWKELTECNWFQEHVARWREELDVSYKARALNEIRAIAVSNNPARFTANKLLLDGAWKQKEKVGRPTQIKIKQEADKLLLDRESIEQDYRRLS